MHWISFIAACLSDYVESIADLGAYRVADQDQAGGRHCQADRRVAGGTFEPEKYKDIYREHVLETIERKAQGEEITIEVPTQLETAVPDLMSALQVSLDDLRKRGRAGRILGTRALSRDR